MSVPFTMSDHPTPRPHTAAPQETLLGPFFFTYRPSPGAEAITIPGFLMPLQWPPTTTASFSPYSAFVYTELAPSPVQPVWSVTGGDVAQWNGSPSLRPDFPLGPSSTSPAPPSSTSPVPPSSQCRGPPAQSHSAPAAHTPPVTHPVSLPEESTSQPSRPSISTLTPTFPLPLIHEDESNSGPTVPVISITKGTDSSPSASPPSGTESASDEHTHPSAASLQPSSEVPTLDSSTESSSKTLVETNCEWPLKKTHRKSIPTEWTRPTSRPSTPFNVVDVDDAPLSPTRERPLSAASNYQQSPGGTLRRRPTITFRPRVLNPSSPVMPGVARAKSMGHMRITSGDQREVARLLTVETRVAPTPPPPSPALQDVTNTFPKTGKVSMSVSLPECPPRAAMRSSSQSPEPGEALQGTSSWGPVRSRPHFNLSILAKTPEATPPVTPLEPSGLQEQQRQSVQTPSSKTLDEIAQEEWNNSPITSLSYKTAKGTSSTLNTSIKDIPSVPSNPWDLVVDATRSSSQPLSSPTASTLPSISSLSSSLLATHGSVSRSSSSSTGALREAQLSNSVQEYEDMQEAVSDLADMLQQTLHIHEQAVHLTEYRDRLDDSPTESDDDVFVIGNVTSSEDEVNVSSPDSEYSTASEENDEAQRCPRNLCGISWAERERILQSASPTPRGTASLRHSPILPSPHYLDVENAFDASRSTSYPPAPDGYVHVDDVTLTSFFSDDSVATDDDDATSDTDDGVEICTESSDVEIKTEGSDDDTDTEGSDDEREVEVPTVPIQPIASVASSPSAHSDASAYSPRGTRSSPGTYSARSARSSPYAFAASSPGGCAILSPRSSPGGRSTPSPRASPHSPTSRSSKRYFPYPRNSSLPTIAEQSEEEESPLRSRFWETRARLVSESVSLSSVYSS